MGDINDQLFDAVNERSKDKVLDVFDKYRNNPELYTFLNVDEALSLSIPTQNIEIIKLLLSCRANVKHTDGCGKRAIHLAAETGNVDIVKLILRAGSPVNVANKEGKTPLHLAIEHGREDIVELLLDAGANINRAQTYQMNEYPIHVAAKKGFIRIISALSAKGANLDAPAAHQRSPLHYAVLHKQYCTVKHLCGMRININATDARGDTALSLALSHGLMAMANTLLDHGARADVRTRSDRTVLHFIPSLMKKSPEPGSNSELYTKLLTSASHCVNLISENGTPLHTAVNLDCVQAAELFLDWGAEVNVEESNGYTPMMLAVGSNNVDIVALLLSRGAHLRGRARDYPWMVERTAVEGNVLHMLLMTQGLSARRSKIDVLKLLLTAGCELNMADNRGFSPLDRHIFSTVPNTGRAEVAELVRAGAVLESAISNANSRHSLILRMRQEGWRDRMTSSLLLCAWHGDLDTANFLLESSCVTCHILRDQDWLTLPGRGDQSESFLAHWRDAMKYPESLTRICRIEIRRHLRRLTRDRDIRDRLCGLALPRMLQNFLTLAKECDAYLNSNTNLSTG